MSAELRARQRAAHDPEDRAYGTLCTVHFNKRGATWGEVDNCGDCLRAQNEYAEKIQNEHTIDPSQPYGQHIALRCKNHPELRWHTKNIDGIGCRSIFYASRDVPECDCPVRLLEVVPR